MIDLADYEAVIDYLSRPMDTRLHALLTGRLKDSIGLGLQDLTHIVVVEPGDTEELLVQALGFSPYTAASMDRGTSRTLIGSNAMPGGWKRSTPWATRALPSSC